MLQLFDEATPDLSDRSRFVELVSRRLKEDAALVEAWQNYSDDKRVDRGPYLDGMKVEFFDGVKFLDKRSHPSHPTRAQTSSTAKRRAC